MGRDAAADTSREASSEMDLVLQGHQRAFENARGWTFSSVPAPWKVRVRKGWSWQVGKEGEGMRESEKRPKVLRERIAELWNNLGWKIPPRTSSTTFDRPLPCKLEGGR